MVVLIIIAFFVLVFLCELADVKREKERRFGIKSNRYR
jgi:hypothetical protein